MSVIATVEESVTATAPKVMAALGRIKFLLVGVPIICILLALVSQTLGTERNIGIVMFKMGSFATPSNPVPVMLASPDQVNARLRQRAREMKDSENPKSLLIRSSIENEMVSVSGTDKGSPETKQFLLDLIQPEIDFQNGRLMKLQKEQTLRQNQLSKALGDLTTRKTLLVERMDANTDPVALLGLQQGIDSAAQRIVVIQRELNQITILNATDLYIDTTQVVQSPHIIASSDWYAPIILGAIGLAVGLFLTLIIAIIAIFRAIGKV